MGNFAADTVFPDECIESFLQSIVQSDFTEPQKKIYYSESDELTPSYSEVEVLVPRDRAVVVSRLRKKLLAQKTLYQKSFESKSLHEQQQERLHAAVDALWTVEQKTTVDLVLKALQATPMKVLRTWVSAELWV